MSKKYIKVNDLSVAQSLYDFINNEAIPDTDINQKNFWQDFSKAVHKLSPKNEELLKFREKLQIDIDKWHIDNKEKEFRRYLRLDDWNLVEIDMSNGYISLLCRVFKGIRACKF